MVIDYYSVLGVAPGASNEQIKEAFRAAAKKWHPDKHVSEEERDRKFAEEMFKKCKQAYDGLCAGKTYGEWAESSQNEKRQSSARDYKKESAHSSGKTPREESYSYRNTARNKHTGTYENAYKPVPKTALSVIFKIIIFVGIIILSAALVIGAWSLLVWIFGIIIAIFRFLLHLLIVVASVFAMYKIITFII